MSISRVSRIGLPLSSDSNTASRRECFWIWRAMAYMYRARTCPGVLPHVSKALRAAATAASTSLLLAAATWVSGFAVDGLMLSIYLPLADLTHSLLINRPKGWCSLIQASPGVAASGAGPYSIVSKMSMMFILRLPARPLGCDASLRNDQ